MPPIQGSTPESQTPPTPRFYVSKEGTKFRLRDREMQNALARDTRTGAITDGGGHENEAKADRQAIYMNEWDQTRKKLKE